jgi:quinol monooxygenase YgiN
MEVMMPFVQIIEFQTDNIDEYNATVDEWLKSSAGQRTPTRSTLSQDRDHPGTYMTIVEFPSYEAAMENSNRSETGEFAARLAALCKGEPTFRNLDVVRQEDL